MRHVIGGTVGLHHFAGVMSIVRSFIVGIRFSFAAPGAGRPPTPGPKRPPHGTSRPLPGHDLQPSSPSLGAFSLPLGTPKNEVLPG
jgi:hypothetical protein